jgi:predicted  nucleic acid-binding Zn-ribbon protein
MLEVLTSLIALQALDTAADAARKRIAEIPAAERALDAAVAAARAVVAEAQEKVNTNAASRRALEKDAALIDGRMAKFEDHKAAVKTNQEFQALNHEIEVALVSKSALEDQIITLLDEADSLDTTLKAAQAELAEQVRRADAGKEVITADRKVQEAELSRLAAARVSAAAAVAPPVLAKYEQLLKGRKGLAVAAMINGLCTACHVRLRPNVEQQVRKSDAIVTCDSCQRMLYYVPPVATDAAATTPPA